MTWEVLPSILDESMLVSPPRKEAGVIQRSLMHRRGCCQKKGVVGERSVCD